MTSRFTVSAGQNRRLCYSFRKNIRRQNRYCSTTTTARRAKSWQLHFGWLPITKRGFQAVFRNIFQRDIILQLWFSVKYSALPNMKLNSHFHICEANISQRSYFIWQSHISLAEGDFRWKKQVLRLAFFWPAQADSNRWPSESESDALSSCATGRYFIFPDLLYHIFLRFSSKICL